MNDQYYFVSPENSEIGPIPWTVLEQMHAAGTIHDETLTAPEGASEWFRFQDLRSQRIGGAHTATPQPNVPVSRSISHSATEASGIRLKGLIPPGITAKVGGERNAAVLAAAVLVLLAFAGFAVLGWLDDENAYSDYAGDSADYWGNSDPDPAAPAFPQFNPNMSAQEYNGIYGQQSSPVTGGVLNRGQGTTQNSMDTAMQNAANAFGSGGTSGQTYQPTPQNKPAALSTFGAKPKRYRNFRGEVREFIGIPPSGWTPLND